MQRLLKAMSLIHHRWGQRPLRDANLRGAHAVRFTWFAWLDCADCSGDRSGRRRDDPGRPVLPIARSASAQVEEIPSPKDQPSLPKWNLRVSRIAQESSPN